jgi:hypothetical protein
MLVALARLDLRIPGCRSLKHKRATLKPLKHQIRTRFEVAVAEVEHQDLWQRATIAVAAVGSEQHHLRRVLHEVQRFVERSPEVEVIDVEQHVLYPER